MGIIKDVVNPIGSLILGAGQAIYNGIEGKRQYDQNFNWNKQVQETSWAREDNQIQRAKADAEAAGFSPLAALGNTATGTTVSAPGTNAQSSIDLSGMMNVLGTLQQQEHESKMQTASLNAQKEMADAANETSKEIAEINAGISKYGTDKSAETAKNQLEEEKRQFDQTFNENLRKSKFEENYQNRTLQQVINAQNEEMQYKYAMMYQEWYKENHAEGAPMGQICKTWDDYNTALKTWLSKATIELDSWGDDTEYEDIKKAISQTQAKLGGEAGGRTGDLLAAIQGLLKSELGTTSGNEGQGRKTIDTAGLNNRRWEAWLRSNPMPVPPMPEEMKRKSKK